LHARVVHQGSTVLVGSMNVCILFLQQLLYCLDVSLRE
jgi:hypothetical protein